jgi:hypothetical protein
MKEKVIVFIPFSAWPRVGCALKHNPKKKTDHALPSLSLPHPIKWRRATTLPRYERARPLRPRARKGGGCAGCAGCVRRLTTLFFLSRHTPKTPSLSSPPNTHPTRRPAAPAPPATFDDLPDDLLPHILALLPQEDRFRASLACRALARAVRPPSAVWADITLEPAQLCNPATVARLLPSLRLAGHSLKRLCFFDLDEADITSTVASVRSILEVAAPHLEDLALFDFASAEDLFMRSARDALASAARLTCLNLNDTRIFAPCRLPGRAWAAAATVEFAHGYPGQCLRQAAVIAAAAAPAGARLAKLTALELRQPEQVSAFDAFAAVAGAGVTHLSTHARPIGVPALAALVAPPAGAGGAVHRPRGGLP